MAATTQDTLTALWALYGDSQLRVDTDFGKADMRNLRTLALCLACDKYACDLEEDDSKRPWRVAPSTRTCPYCKASRVMSGAEIAIINQAQDAQKEQETAA